MSTFIHWAPRILSLAFVGFLSLFALDVFTSPFEWTMLLGFVIHLLPSFALLAIVLVAWRYPVVGAVAFVGFALGYIWLAGLGRPWSWYAGISGPSLIVGILYLLDWLRRKKNQPYDHLHQGNQRSEDTPDPEAR